MVAILKWMFVLVLLLVVAGGGAAYWFYTRSDEGLRLLVLEQLRAMAPSLKIDIARAQFDSMGIVRLTNLTVYLPDDPIDRPSLEVDEVIAMLEPNSVADLEFIVQKIFVVKPKVRMIRRTDGKWNWQQVVIQPTEGATPLDIEIEHAAILAEFQLPDKPSRFLKFKNFNVSAHPADSKHLTILIATELIPSGPAEKSPSGPLMVKVDAALDGSTWKCESRDPWRVPVNQELLKLGCDLSTFVADKVAQFGPWLDKSKSIASGRGSSSFSTKFASQRTSDSVMPELGGSCECELTFRVQKSGQNQPLDFEVHAAIANGEIHNRLLPFPINDLGGTIYVDNRQIIVTGLQAASGETKITFDGDVIPSKPMTATIKVRDVELTDALKSRLPEGLRKVVQSLALKGICDADATVTQNGGAWDFQAVLFLKNGTVTHERFPLTVGGVSGKLEVHDGTLSRGPTGEWRIEKGLVKFNGHAKHAGQDVGAVGTIVNPGPLQEGEIVVSGNNLPIDDESLAACPGPVRTSIESLNLKGRHNFRLQVNRRAGPDQKWEPELIEKVHHASLSFNNFPYVIQDLTGVVTWKGDLVQFKQLSGVHNGAKLEGQGRFLRLPGPGRLDLLIDATNASFDRSLEEALPTNLKIVWDHFQPQGTFDARTTISWVPGRPCIVKLPQVNVRDGKIAMRCFPWTLQNLTGQFAYNTEPGKLEIADVQAKHESTALSAKGSGMFSGRENWRLDFSELAVDGLKPDVTFRDSLPEALQKAFDTLQPKGNFSLRGPISFFELPSENKSVGATWKLETILSDCSIQAGTPVDSINGSVKLNGQWDGIETTMVGELDLDSLWLFRRPSNQGFQFTKVRGPIALRDGKFVAGMDPAVLLPQLNDSPDERKRIRGDFIDGVVFLDTQVNLDNDAEHTTFVELKRGKLENYARQYLRQQSGLAGVMNGWMRLNGKRTSPDRMVGEGKLFIQPAALYDSPAIAQIFQIFKFQPPNRRAFEKAEANFTVGGGRFAFNRIEMQGEALSMLGQGYVRFDGGMQMDFGIYLRQFNMNPFRMSAVQAVKVTGVVGEPKVERVALPDLDENLRQFIKAFDPQQMAPATGLFYPRIGRKTEPAAQ